jgi:hypothetical protein
MNNQVHPKLRPFINWFSPIDADNVKLGHALRESANDGEPNNEPKSQRPCGCDANQGARHETATASEPILNPGRRRQMHHGLTQQATNNTCVTARRDEHSNDEHTLRRESSGTGPSDCARMVCSCCDWCGPWREQSDEFMSTKLLSDARGHREDVEQRWMPIVERSEVTR